MQGLVGAMRSNELGPRGGWPVFLAVHVLVFAVFCAAVMVLRSGGLGLGLDWVELFHLVRRAGWSGAASAAPIAALGTAALALSAQRGVQRSALYGDARFATPREIRRAKLVEPSGVLIGRMRAGGPLLRSSEMQHVCYVAPPGSYKTAGFVMPNLLSWPGSALVLDVKNEIYEATAGYRQQHGQQVFRWSPGDREGRSHRYNPLAAVSDNPRQRVTDLQRLAAILVPTPPTAPSTPMWEQEARDLFVGLAQWLLEDPDSVGTIGEIYRLLKAEDGLEARIAELLAARPDFPSVSARLSLASWAAKPIKERSGVRTTLTGALSLWANPQIDAATAASDFRFEDLRRTAMTVYVGVSLDNLRSLSRLLAVFFEQAVTTLVRALPEADEPHTVLMLLDEFAALGRMDMLASSLAQLRGYHVRIALIIQGLSQLEEHYGRAGRESLLQNAAIQLFSAPNDELTPRYLSERLGKTTIRTLSRSHGSGIGQGSRSYSYAQRDLMLPEETSRLPSEQLIVLKQGARPVLGTKIRYFAEPIFSSRVLPAPQVPELVLAAPPAAPSRSTEFAADVQREAVRHRMKRSSFAEDSDQDD